MCRNCTKVSRIMILLFSVILLLLCGCSMGVNKEPGIDPDDKTTETDSPLQIENGDVHQEGAESGPEKEKGTMDYEKTYYSILGNYLKEQLGLEQYDEEISGYGCFAVEANDQKETQIRGNMGLTYIYLRNDLYLERLSNEDREILEECAKNWTGTAGSGTGKAKSGTDGAGEDAEDVEGERAEEMVIRTFAACITPREITSEADRKVKTIYDESAFDVEGSNRVTMDSLVLQIATRSEYDENGNFVDVNNEAKKERELYDLAARMEDEMEGLLGDTPVRVLVDYIK